MKRAIALTALVALTSCRFVPGAKAHDIHEAQEAVRYQLNDPDAGQFRNEKVIGTAGNRTVRGQVNAKNRMGAYVGFRPYAYAVSTKRATVMPELDGSNEAAMAVLAFPSACAA